VDGGAFQRISVTGDAGKVFRELVPVLEDLESDS
jgi:hypothetical protein